MSWRRLFTSCRAPAALLKQGRLSLLLPDHQTSHGALGRLACLALLGAVGVGSTAQAEAEAQEVAPPHTDKGWNMLSLEQRRRVFFKYEKRIREMSPQEKVFDYFASQRDASGVSYMLPADMLRSVVPVFPPEGSSYIRGGQLAGEPGSQAPQEESEFFKNFDIDGDGRISFDEWCLFTMLLSIPAEDIQVAFRILDTDGSGYVDMEEFGKLLDALHRKASRPSATMRHVSHNSSIGDAPRPRFGLILRFFGKDGKQQLSLESFAAFISALREEMVRLEFEYYDYQRRGYMTGRDFAYSVVGCASPKFIEGYLNQVHDMPPELSAGRITLPDLLAFRSLWRQLRLLSVALEFIQTTNGSVTPADFKWVAENICRTKLSKAQVDIIFYLFPAKDKGLNVHYMHKVLRRHHAAGLTLTYDYEQNESPLGIFDCIKDCYTQR